LIPTTDLDSGVAHSARNATTRLPADLAQFFSFVRSPTRRYHRREKPGRVFRTIAVLFALNAFFTLAVSVPTYLLLQSLIGLTPRSSIEPVAFLVLSVTVGPLVEEALFRAGLRSARWTMCGMPALIALYVQGWQSALAIAAVTSLALLVDAATRYRMRPGDYATLRWRRGRAFIERYPLIVHGYALAFAMIHIVNYVYDPTIGWHAGLVVFAVSSQLVLGLMLSFVRLRFGLQHAIVAHGVWNALVHMVDAVIG